MVEIFVEVRQDGTVIEDTLKGPCGPKKSSRTHQNVNLRAPVGANMRGNEILQQRGPGPREHGLHRNYKNCEKIKKYLQRTFKKKQDIVNCAKAEKS